MVKHSDLCYKVTNNISHVQHINAASLVFCASKPTCPTSVDRCAPCRLTDVGHVDLGVVKEGEDRVGNEGTFPLRE